LLLAVPARYKQTKLASQARVEHPELAAPFEDLDEPQRYQLFQYSQSLAPATQNPQLIGGQMYALHATIAEQSPSWLATLAYFGVYGGALCLVLAFGVLVGLDVYREGEARIDLVVAEITDASDEVDDLLAEAKRLEARGPNDVGLEGRALTLRLEAGEKLRAARHNWETAQPPISNTKRGRDAIARVELLEQELWNKVPGEAAGE
jgi:hypothetical protein